MFGSYDPWKLSELKDYLDSLKNNANPPKNQTRNNLDVGIDGCARVCSKGSKDVVREYLQQRDWVNQA